MIFACRQLVPAIKMESKPMWLCPDCGREFTQTGQSHSCGPYTVVSFLSQKSAAAAGLYRKFEALVLGLAGTRLALAKTRIGFQNRRIFAAVNRLGKQHLSIHIVTANPIGSSRIQRIEKLAENCYVNHLRVSAEDELDSELVGWLKLGFEWGES